MAFSEPVKKILAIDVWLLF